MPRTPTSLKGSMHVLADFAMFFSYHSYISEHNNLIRYGIENDTPQESPWEEKRRHRQIGGDAQKSGD